MSESTGEILIPRENVNDDTATLLSWRVADGANVEAGQVVAQIETSKATVDLVSPCSGTLRHSAKAGQDVPIGAPIGIVGSGVTAPSVAVPSAVAPAVAPPMIQHMSKITEEPQSLSPSVRRMVTEHQVEPEKVQGTGRNGRLTKGDVIAHLDNARPAPSSTRISPQAQALIAQLGLDEKQFQGRGLIRVSDVQPPAPKPVAAVKEAVPTAAKPTGATGVRTRSEKLSRAKRTEGSYLRSGFQNTLASVVTVPCRTKGFRAAAGSDTTAIIIHELARLLRKYPLLNAYHHDGDVHYYEEVHVGFAVDAGKGLKVPVIRDADTKGITAIAEEMRELVVDYLNDSLSVQALSGGTFTVTDLSGEGVTNFHPLINQGQSAILGIGAEVFQGTTDGIFNLILAFDHQLAEGRSASKFLNELRERVGFHEASMIPASAGLTPAAEPCCSRCQRGHAELSERKHYLVQTYKSDGTTRPICSICFNGWT